MKDQVKKTIERLKGKDRKPGYTYGAYIRGERENVVKYFTTIKEAESFIEDHPDFKKPFDRHCL